MATYTHIDGFEHGVISTAGTGLYDTVVAVGTGATITASGTAARSGSYGLLCSHGSTAGSVYAAKTGSGTVAVGVGYVRIPTLFSAELIHFETRYVANGVTQYARIGINASNQFFADFYDGSAQGVQTATGFGAISANTWYRVEWRVTVSGTTHTIDWQLATGDGAATAQTQVSYADGFTGSINEWRYGSLQSRTTNAVHVDDVAWSSTSGDYPLGPVKLLGYSPNAVGTHNLDAATSAYFFQNSGSDTALTTSETTSYQQVDDVPLSADTNHIKVKATSSSANVAFDASSESHTGTSGSVSQASFTWNHGGSASARAAVVFVWTIASAPIDTGVTYNGVAMTQLYSGFDTDTEPGGVRAYFLDNVSTGTQAVVVSRTNNATTMYATCITFTSSSGALEAPTSLIKTQGGTTANTGASSSGTGTSATSTMALDDGSPGGNSMRVIAIYTGAATPPTAGANTTLAQSIDLGSWGGSTGYETTPSSGSKTIGFASANDDLGLVGVVVRGVPSGGSPAGTEYAEYAFADSAESTDPAAVRSIVALRNDSGTTANSITAKLRANSNETNIFSGDIGSASNIYKALVSNTAPGGAAWTDAIFDGATLRWGYTSDPDSIPRLESAMLEALFTITAGQTQAVSGIASASSLGSPTMVPGNVNQSVSGLASASSLGTVTIVPGGTTVSVGGISSASLLGTQAFNLAFPVTGIGSASSLGAVTLQPGNTNVAVSGIGSAQSHGAVTIVPGGVTQAVSGIASASSLGVPSVTTGGGNQDVPVSGISSASSLGAVQTNIAFSISGLASASSLGAPTAAPGGVTVSVAGIASASQLGSVLIVPGGTVVAVSGLGSASSFGVVEGDIAFTVTGAGSASLLGAVTILVGNTNVAVAGVPSASNFGAPTIVGGAAILFDPATQGGYYYS